MKPPDLASAASQPNYVKLSAMSWTRFNIVGLTIAPSLAGSSLSFGVDGVSAEIRLPDRPKKTPNVRRGAAWSDDNISCHAWSSKTGRAVTFTVHTVDVLVDIQKRVSVPAAALGSRNARLFTKAQREQLDAVANRGNEIARVAVERWLRVLRWKSLHGQIGHPEIVSRRVSGWAPGLVDAASRRHFYGATQVIDIVGSFSRQGVSPSAWRATERALRQNVEAPVWFDFLFEGQHRISTGDLHAGILCLAVAVESIARVLLTKHLRRPVNDQIVVLLNRANISAVLEQWEDLGFWDARWQAATDLPRIKRLFKLRNGIMHRGDRALVKAAECQGIASAVRAFILHAANTAERLRA